MINHFKPGEWKTIVWYELAFDDGRNNGFGFPCTEQGDPLLSDNPAAQSNYKYCLEHPGKFVRYNKVIRHEQDYKAPARGVCKCGEEIELVNEYMGGCECPNCGQWYNLFGQELNPPETWPDGDDW